MLMQLCLLVQVAEFHNGIHSKTLYCLISDNYTHIIFQCCQNNNFVRFHDLNDTQNMLSLLFSYNSIKLFDTDCYRVYVNLSCNATMWEQTRVRVKKIHALKFQLYKSDTSYKRPLSCIYCTCDFVGRYTYLTIIK